jgi:hypothetical protein
MIETMTTTSGVGRKGRPARARVVEEIGMTMTGEATTPSKTAEAAARKRD